MGTTRSRAKPGVTAAEEDILREATKYLIRKVGGHLVATGLREDNPEARRWVITVTLRYPTGYEAYYGDLLYDGKKFTLLTPSEARQQRERAIAEDPSRLQKWHESRNPPRRLTERTCRTAF